MRHVKRCELLHTTYVNHKVLLAPGQDRVRDLELDDMGNLHITQDTGECHFVPAAQVRVATFGAAPATKEKAK